MQIGYTNVGKSALMNKLLGRVDVVSHNRLFETLKTTSRSFALGKNFRGVLIDTIGFISSLPSELVDSFSSTFREIESADVVVLIEDISDPLYLQHRKVAIQTVEKIGMGHLLSSDKLVRVWNKIDCITRERIDKCLAAEEEPSSILLSSIKNDQGVEEIRAAINTKASAAFKRESRHILHDLDEHEDRMEWLRE